VLWSPDDLCCCTTAVDGCAGSRRVPSLGSIGAVASRCCRSRIRPPSRCSSRCPSRSSLRPGTSFIGTVGQRPAAWPESNCSRRSATRACRVQPGTPPGRSSGSTGSWPGIATSWATSCQMAPRRADSLRSARDRRLHHLSREQDALRVVLRRPEGRRAPDLGHRRDPHGKVPRNRIDLPKARLIDDDPLRSRECVDPAKRDDRLLIFRVADVESRVRDTTVPQGPRRPSAPGVLDRARSWIAIAAFETAAGRLEGNRAAVHSDSFDDDSRREHSPIAGAREEQAANLFRLHDANARHEKAGILVAKRFRDGRRFRPVDEMPRDGSGGRHHRDDEAAEERYKRSSA